MQHLLFWVFSFYAFLYVFKIRENPGEIDYIYTALFHATILPPVYLNLKLLLPKQGKTKWWRFYFPCVIILIIVFSWLNYSFFDKWSNTILPDYFFISYFTFWQVTLFFVVYLGITSLLKISKSWFVVNALQKELLAAEKQKIQTELMALRTQMNPHFIFNCMNSIKALIQLDEKDNAIAYLTTFSKLIRIILNNSDRQNITLYDEIETCRLYLQLEALRFNAGFSYTVNVEDNIDLKSVEVPALIVQPFIENAIWHGIASRGRGGNVSLNVINRNGIIEIKVEDDGIGREGSQQNKTDTGLSHKSKGMSLTQSRLELDNLLRQRQAQLEIIDKKDEKGIAKGTAVIIRIREDVL